MLSTERNCLTVCYTRAQYAVGPTSIYTIVNEHRFTICVEVSLMTCTQCDTKLAICSDVGEGR